MAALVAIAIFNDHRRARAPTVEVPRKWGAAEEGHFILRCGALPCRVSCSLRLHCLTVWLNTGEVLPLRFVLPLYTAVMECVPTLKVDVANVALKVDVLTFMVASVAVPFLNVTVPLTDTPDGGTTVAVKVTDLLRVEGLSEETRAVVVAALFTVSVSTAELLAASLLLPA